MYPTHSFQKRKTFLPFHKPSIGAEEIESVTKTLKSGWLSTGPMVKDFEALVCKYLNAKHSIALNSGTAALHLALKAIGLQANDEVIIPTNTFTATGEVITYFNAKPVLVDCRKDNFNIDESLIESKITTKTKAIIPVHFAGNPCEMDTIKALGKKYNLKIIEDAAHALTSKYKNKLIGNVGDITCFSFYATKNITTGEGGMVVTSNSKYAERIRRLSLHGISKDAWNRYSQEGSWFYEVVEAGYKYNMSDILAAIGKEQIKKAEYMLDKRTKIAESYSKALKNVKGVSIPQNPQTNKHAWHLYVIIIDLNQLTIDRDQFINKLKQYNIGSSVHFIPLHRHPYYKNTYNYSPKEFPNSEYIYKGAVSLPIYPSMTTEDSLDVIAAVKNIVESHRN